MFREKMLKTIILVIILSTTLYVPAYGRCTGGTNSLNFHGGGSSDDLEALLLFSTTTTFLVITTEITCGLDEPNSGYSRSKRSFGRVSSEDKQEPGDSDRETKLNETILPHFNENYEKIKEESARGIGENLEVLASLYGCRSSVYPEFMKLMRQQYLIIFQDYTENIDKVNKIQMYIELDDLLSSSCRL